jgi:hypothetical protein
VRKSEEQYLNQLQGSETGRVAGIVHFDSTVRELTHENGRSLHAFKFFPDSAPSCSSRLSRSCVQAF